MSQNGIAGAINRANNKALSERERLRDQYVNILQRIARDGHPSLSDDEADMLTTVMKQGGFEYHDVEHHVELLRRCHAQRELVEDFQRREANLPDAHEMRRELKEDVEPEIRRLQQRQRQLEKAIDDAGRVKRNREEAKSRCALVDQHFKDALAPIVRR